MKKFLLFCALGLATLGGAMQAASANVDVYVGYADGLRGGGFFPSPWSGDPGVEFQGFSEGGSYDAGAIMFVNTGASTVSVGSFMVDGFSNGASFSIWSDTTIDPGKRLILTQTHDFNFDSSDDSIYGPPGGPATPVVHYLLDGTPNSATDTGQVLNTHDFDFAAIGNESFRWRLIGTNGTPGGVPEPGTLALVGSGLLSLGGIVLRRRAGRK